MTSGTGRRPGRPKGGQVVADRAQLLAAAAAVIRSRGPDATMDDIAAGASVTKPILYRSVGDKAALMRALSEGLVDEIDRAVQTAAVGAIDPRSAFESAIRGYLTAVAADRNLYLFVNSAAPGTDAFRHLVDRSAGSMTAAFTRARTRAGLDPDGAESWAWAIIGALQVVAMMWLRDEHRDLELLVDDITEVLWSGLGSMLGPTSPSSDRR